MTITASWLTKGAAIATVAAGLIFVAVQINHPPMTAESTLTAEWMVRNIAKTVMAVLSMIGVTGIYLHQYRKAGVLGFIGWLTLFVGYVTIAATVVIASTVLPGLGASNPDYVNAVLVAADGGTPAMDIGPLYTFLALSGVIYLVGGLIFAISLLRARVVWRWASILLGLGVLGTGALAVLPETFNRPMAVVIGVALVGLGLSLWSKAASSDSSA